MSALVTDGSMEKGEYLRGGRNTAAIPFLWLYASGADIHNKEMLAQP